MLRLNHKNMNIWKAGMRLLKEIYTLTGSYPRSETYGLAGQSRRAAVSILSNFSEGSAKGSKRDRRRFYEISRASAVELDTHLEIAQELNYTAGKDLSIASKELNPCSLG